MYSKVPVVNITEKKKSFYLPRPGEQYNYFIMYKNMNTNTLPPVADITYE
jgi:hypothetical protein